MVLLRHYFSFIAGYTLPTVLTSLFKICALFSPTAQTGILTFNFQRPFCWFKLNMLVNGLDMVQYFHHCRYGEVAMENGVWKIDGVKQARNGSRSKFKGYLHKSKREEGCEGPSQESRAHLAVGCWQPGEKEWIPLRRKYGGQRGREGQSQGVIGHGGKKHCFA